MAIARLKDGLILEVKEGFARVLGWSREELLGKTSMELGLWAQAEDRERMVQSLRESNGFTQLELALRGRDSRPLKTHAVCRLIKSCGEEQILISLKDVGEASCIQKALQVSEARNRALLSALPDLMFINDREGNYLDFHASHPEDLILPPEVFLRRNVKDIFPESFAAPFLHSYRAALDTREIQNHRYEFPINGKQRFFESRVVPCTQDTVLTIVRDVTKETLAVSALLESEERFRVMYENTLDALFWIRVEEDGSFNIESINPAQERILGRPCQEITGKRIAEIMLPELAEQIQARYQKCVQSGQPLHYEEGVTLCGETRTFQTLLVPVRNAHGRIYRIVGRSHEITQERQFEEALRQTQKLESLGVLAGGIAHDFNNLLTAMLGNLNLAQLDLDPTSPVQPTLKNIEDLMFRASELTKQMLAYAGKGRFVVLPHDLNHLLRDMESIMRTSIPKKTELRFELAETLPTMEADATQIHQAIFNLVINASEAMGEASGIIRIATRVEHLDEACLGARFPNQAMSPGNHVVLEVSDTGCGIPPSILNRIFDPFFSTKFMGRGLGLSAMQGILRGHRAGIQIASEPGQGSTFTLYFPAHNHASVQPPPPSADKPTREQGRILLVDDEEMVRRSTAMILKALGFDVLEAVDGLDALKQFETAQDAIDLVLMDLSMPRMSGSEAFVHLQAIRPGLPVILCSGFSEEEALRESFGQTTGPLGFLQKPFALKDLKKALEQVFTPAKSGKE